MTGEGRTKCFLYGTVLGLILTFPEHRLPFCVCLEALPFGISCKLPARLLPGKSLNHSVPAVPQPKANGIKCARQTLTTF